MACLVHGTCNATVCADAKDKIDETKDRWANQAFVNTQDAVASEHANFYALAGIDVLGQVIEMVEDMRPTLEGEE